MAEEEPMDLPGRQEPLQPKPGGLLRAAREERGLSLDEMVVQTKLPRSMLDAIENDNFELLSEPVYVRGYYRKYARVVGADEAAVIAGYEAHAGGQLPKLEIPVLLQDEPLPKASVSEFDDDGGSQRPERHDLGLAALGVVRVRVRAAVAASRLRLLDRCGRRWQGRALEKALDELRFLSADF